MTTPSKTKPHFEQLLSDICTRRPHKNNQKVYYIASKQDQIKTNLIVKTVVALKCMCSIIKILHLQYCPVCNV